MPALLLGPVHGTAVPRRRPEWCIYVAEKQPVLEPGEGLHAPPVTSRRGTGASGRLISPSQLTGQRRQREEGTKQQPPRQATRGWAFDSCGAAGGGPERWTPNASVLLSGTSFYLVCGIRPDPADPGAGPGNRMQASPSQCPCEHREWLMLQQAPYLGVPSYRANTFLQAPDGSQPHPRPNHKAHTCF